MLIGVTEEARSTFVSGGVIYIGVHRDLNSSPISILESNVKKLLMNFCIGLLKFINIGVYILPSTLSLIYKPQIQSV